MLDRFHTIVVGIDGTDQGFAALAQARLLLAPRGRLIALVVCEEGLAYQGAGFDAPRMAAEVEEAAEAALKQARRLLADVPTAEARLVHGPPTDWLLAAAEEAEADAIAVGSHQHRRTPGILLGSVATEILHKAPRSVLVARAGERAWGGAIVAGVDGSRESLEALAVARELADERECTLDAIVADGGKALDVDALVPIVREIRWVHTHPVDALVEASTAADLVVVGSRGLHGLASLGSVSERVAHRAACSVLVVRKPRLEAPPGGASTRLPQR
jgi:nucleotide-binding universal stress UspA family protein